MTYGYKTLEDGTLVPYPIDTQPPVNTLECPNCITPWKCNGPHLLKGSEYHYQSIDGYYIKENEIWKFFPFEKGLDSEELLDIAHTLQQLNKRRSELTDTI